MTAARNILRVLLIPSLALCAMAQDAPRLDGSNVKQPPHPFFSGKPGNAPQPNAAAPLPSLVPKGIPSLVPKGTGDTATGTATTAPVSTQPPTPADKPAEPATVQFSGGLLTIHASNSSLTQILRDTSTQTGMQLDGTPEDVRIFGDFGPAPVNTVIGQLLDGGPSNYVLFGRNANLAPRTLVVTSKTSLAPGQVAGVTPVKTANNDDDDDDDDAPAPPQQIRPLIPPHTTPPEANGSPTPNVRTPQQILDDMQRRRQEQQQQQPENP